MINEALGDDKETKETAWEDLNRPRRISGVVSTAQVAKPVVL